MHDERSDAGRSDERVRTCSACGERSPAGDAERAAADARAAGELFMQLEATSLADEAATISGT